MIKEDLLRKKGWSEEDIKKAMQILGKKRKTFFSDTTTKIIYWAALLITIAGNFFVSVVTLPFFIMTPSAASAFIYVFFIALMFGLLFNVLLKDLEMFDSAHHVIIEIFLPVVVLINAYIIINVADGLIKGAKAAGDVAKVTQNPIVISVIYAAAFMLPYFTRKLFQNNS